MKAYFSPMGMLLAVLIAAVLSSCGPMLDRRDEVASAKREELRQKQDAREDRQQRAAQAMCASDYGPHVLAVWVDSTTVKCVGQRGNRIASYSIETSHAK